MAWDDGRGNDGEQHDRGHADGGRSAGDVARLVPAVVLVIAVVAFALANTEKTEVNFLFTETRAPLILVLLATAVVGALIGALLRRRHKH